MKLKRIISLFVIMLISFVGISSIKVNATDFTTSDLVVVEGAQIRTTGNQGLRFVANKDRYTGTNIVAWGILLAYGEASASETFVKDGTVNGKTVLCAEMTTLNEEGKFAATLINIPENAYTQKVTARAYFLITNGIISRYIYSKEVVTRSIYQVAQLVKADTSYETNTYIENVIAKSEAYIEASYLSKLTYEYEDDTKSSYKITSAEKNITEMVIPNEINELPVTSIGNYAFGDCSRLTSITIPEGVTSIGESAFSYCSSLTSITIPESVTSIGDYAFYNCNSLTNIAIPEGVTSIENRAFSECSSLTSVIILDGVTSIGDSAFSGCISLTSITIPGSVKSIGGFAFNECTSLASVIILDGVTSIGDSAFSGCISLTSITIPTTVTTINDYAFYGCNKLVEVYDKSSTLDINKDTLNGYVGNYALNIYTSDGGSKITQSGDYQFYIDNENNKYYLIGYLGTDTSITLPNKINGKSYSIYDYAFSRCNSLISVTIPEGVTSIGASAFSYCTSLTSVIIPEGVTSIGDYAFNYCDLSESIIIPVTVEKVGFDIFCNCTSIIIKCCATSQPTGWNDYWNISDHSVIWGYTE